MMIQQIVVWVSAVSTIHFSNSHLFFDFYTLPSTTSSHCTRSKPFWAIRSGNPDTSHRLKPHNVHRGDVRWLRTPIFPLWGELMMSLECCQANKSRTSSHDYESHTATMGKVRVWRKSLMRLCSFTVGLLQL